MKIFAPLFIAVIAIAGLVFAAFKFLKPSVAPTGKGPATTGGAGSAGGAPTSGSGSIPPLLKGTAASNNTTDLIPGVSNQSLYNTGSSLLADLFGGGGNSPGSTYTTDPSLLSGDILSTDTLTALDSTLTYPSDNSGLFNNTYDSSGFTLL